MSTSVHRWTERIDDLLPFVSVALVLLAWQVGATALDDPLLLPRPMGVIDALIVMALEEGSLWRHLSATLIRVFVGFFAAVAVGIPLGLLMGSNDGVNFVLDPIVSFGYPIPKIAFYPLFLIVLGLGTESKVALVFLECLVPIIIGAYVGVADIDEQYIWSAKNLGADDWNIFRGVMLPASLPYIFSGLRTAMPIAFIVAVVTEMISSTRGIGYIIAFNAGSFALDRMFVGIFAAGLVGYAFDRSLGLIRDRLLFWAESVDLDV